MSYLRLSGAPVTLEEIVDQGLNGILLQQGHDLLKIPKIQNTSDLSGDDARLVEHYNKANRHSHTVEKGVYLRVWPHGGLIDRVNVTEDGILLQRLRNGNLEVYITNQAEPKQDVKAQWIHRIISTVSHFHRKRVLLYDIAARNTLIADDGSLRFIDFGQCTIFPEDTDMSVADDNGCSVITDIFQLGCLIFSIATWRVFHFDIFAQAFRLPKLEKLPSIDAVFCSSLIEGCWCGIYNDIEQLEKGFNDLIKKL